MAGTCGGEPTRDPWRLLAGMRTRIAHEYFDVDYAIVAATLREDLPRLIAQFEAILGCARLGQRHLPLTLTLAPCYPAPVLREEGGRP